MNKKKIAAVYICVALFICIIATYSSAFVSPGMEVISNDISLIKCGVVNCDVAFEKSDFVNVLGNDKIKSITVLSLPDCESGELKLGEINVCENQTVGVDNISLLSFRPGKDVKSNAVFDLSVNCGKEEYAIKCEVKILSNKNSSPVMSEFYKDSIKTYENVTYYGIFNMNDPDKDLMCYELVEAPKHGTLTITDNVGGAYKYTPDNGYKGKDSFVFRVHDEYGNYADSQKVSVMVEKNTSGVYYCDIENKQCHNDAIRLAQEGIMVGYTIGKSMVFGPDYRVSRAEFLAMAMDVCKISADETLTRTDFKDNDDIPKHLVKYVATAKKMGLIDGVEYEGNTYFYPNNTITRAEAAVIINKMLDLPTNATVAVFADNSDIPSWAVASIYALRSNGILSGTNTGKVNANDYLTRAQASSILCSIIDK